MRKALMALALVAALAPMVQAHAGHDQKVMGTVASIQRDHLQVTTADGNSSMITLNQQTTVLGGKEAKKPSDIKVGGRVVVTATDVKDTDGKTMLVAKQVSLGNASATVPKK